MTVCYFSLLFECARAHTLKINALFVRRLSFSIPGWCYGLLLPFSFSSLVVVLLCIFFCILPHEYATQRETYTSNKLSLGINRPLDFIKYFFLLFSSFKRKTIDEQNRQKAVQSRLNFVYLLSNLFFFFFSFASV